MSVTLWMDMASYITVLCATLRLCQCVCDCGCGCSGVAAGVFVRGYHRGVAVDVAHVCSQCVIVGVGRTVTVYVAGGR